MGALWRTHMALPDQRNGFNASPGICPALFHPCSTLFHQFGATRSAYGRKRPFLAVLDPVWQPSGTPRWPSLTRKTVPIHHWGCAVTCSTLVSLCSTSLEPPDPLMLPKRPFLAVLDALGALWHTHMALPDPQNCSNSSLGMCRDLFHPCFTLFHQFRATRSAYGRKRLFLAVLDPFGSPLAHPHGPP